MDAATLTDELIALFDELPQARDAPKHLEAIIARARELHVWLRVGAPPWEND